MNRRQPLLLQLLFYAACLIVGILIGYAISHVLYWTIVCFLGG
jgi:hypothetical protein